MLSASKIRTTSGYSPVVRTWYPAASSSHLLVSKQVRILPEHEYGDRRDHADSKRRLRRETAPLWAVLAISICHASNTYRYISRSMLNVSLRNCVKPRKCEVIVSATVYKNSLLQSLDAQVIKRLSLEPVTFEAWSTKSSFRANPVATDHFVEEGMASSDDHLREWRSKLRWGCSGMNQ